MKKKFSLAAVLVVALALTLPALASGGTQVTLEGEVKPGAPQLISVTMPYRVLFSVQTEPDGTVSHVSSAEAAVKNGSNCAVKLQITKVVDDSGLLGKVKLALVEHSAGEDVALHNGRLTAGAVTAIDLVTLGKGGETRIKVVGAAIDSETRIETASYTVTPTITVTAAP